MGLENLKSIFAEDLDNNIESFSSNVITNVNDTKLIQFPRPVLGELGQSPLDGMSWESLYESNHSPKDDPSHNGETPISYGPNVSRDNLNIRNPNDGRFGFAGSSRTSVISAVGKLIGQVPGWDGDVQQFLQDTGKEPYIVSNIGPDGRVINSNFLGRAFPIERSMTDTVRIAKFLTSPAGVLFIGKQELLGQQNHKYKNGYNPVSTLGSTLARVGGGPQHLFDRTEPSLNGLLSFLEPDVGIFDEYPEFNVFDEPTAIANLSGGTGSPLGRKGLAKLQTPTTVQPGGLTSLHDTFTGDGEAVAGKTYPISSSDKPHGDRMTLAPMVTGESLEEIYEDAEFFGGGFDVLTVDVEAEKEGMPFYFKDMRDDTYLFFRAFIEGLSESISPSYNSTQYIGRSEPVYTYSQTEREINFTLKLFAQTKQELSKIYEKMNRLTSLCYPEYFKDEGVSYGNRMKPPLTKLRIGDMFGSSNSELQGYIKSLSYAVDEASPWEISVGERVPKYVIASIGYQVIHATSPNLETQFYGYIGA